MVRVDNMVPTDRFITTWTMCAPCIIVYHSILLWSKHSKNDVMAVLCIHSVYVQGLKQKKAVRKYT